MIHWSRQLKDVLNSQDMSGLDETAGPLEEIEFWKNRNQDLMGISKQLNKPSVKRITLTLDLAKSSYISSFMKLSRQIQVCILLINDLSKLTKINGFLKGWLKTS